MPHLDPDRLVLIALGEQAPSTEEAGHLDHCTACAADLAATRTVAGVGRDSHHLRELPPPPEDLWQRIAEEAFATPVAPLKPAAKGSRRSYALVAAIAAIIGVGVTVIVQQAHRGDTRKVVAEADLTPQKSAPPGAHGTAQIIDTGHGLQMRVDIVGMPATVGYYTVWLYDGGDVMIPIGSPGAGALNLPAAADDLTKFGIVDISAQKLGQQEHGTSMLQGKLSG